MTIPMSDIISRARILSSKIFEQVVAAVSLRNRPIGQSSPSKTGHREFKIKCIRCGGAHLIKEIVLRESGVLNVTKLTTLPLIVNRASRIIRRTRQGQEPNR